MRSLIAVFFVLIFISSANAINIDSECNNKGFDYTIAHYEWNQEGYEEVYSTNDFSTNIQGNQEIITWNSNQVTDAIIIYEDCAYQVLVGEMQGTTSAVNLGDNINTIIFCGNNSSEEDENEEYAGDVPEFGVITIILVFVISLLFVTRKRK